MIKAISNFCKEKSITFLRWKVMHKTFYIKESRRAYLIILCPDCGGANIILECIHKEGHSYCPDCNLLYLNFILSKPLTVGPTSLYRSTTISDITFILKGFLHGIQVCKKHNQINRYRIIKGEYRSDVSFCTGCYNEKVTSEKYKDEMDKTYLAKYGKTKEEYHRGEEFQTKARNTNKKRYGVTHYSKTNEFLKRTRETNLERFGATNIWKSAQFKEDMGTRNFEDTVSLLWELKSYLEYYNITEPSISGDTKYTSILSGTLSESNETFYISTIQALNGSSPYENKRTFQEDVIHEALSKVIALEIIREHSISIYDETIDKTRYLRIDFYIPLLSLAIEYNGEQHYSPRWRGQQGLADNIHRDNLKAQYCVDSGIRLICIPWHEVYSKDREIFLNNAITILKDILNEL